MSPRQQVAVRAEAPPGGRGDRVFHRLRMVVVAMAALHLLSLLLDLVNQQLGYQAPEHQLGKNMTSLAIIAASFGILGAAGLRGARRRLEDIGLAYEVAVSFGIAFSLHLTPWPAEGVIHYQLVRSVSWVCIWIIIFPLLVPSSPGKTAAAAFASASMGPAALMITVLIGNPRPAALTMLYLFIPNYISAALAVFGSRVVHQLQTDVNEARRLGNYELEELIDRGGMGEVWRARHRLLVRPAAVKLIRGELSEGQGVIHRRFEQEAQAVAALRSPHTIEIFDFGIEEDGALYYVMELLEGTNVEELVQRFGPAPPERCVHILSQVCRSLADAHRRDLVHRDIKPSNIYLCCPGLQYDFVKVLDFGLVLKLNLAEGAAGRLTADGRVSGTPAYMAPEMAAESEAIDARVDLYALGCVGYFLLTGRPVFESCDPAELAMMHMTRAPAAPSRYRRGIPAGLEEVILSCLAKDPLDRPGSAHSLAAALASCELPGPWTQDRAAAWWKRRLPHALEAATSRAPGLERRRL